MLGRVWREYLRPLFSFGPYPFIASMKHDESISDDEVTVEYMADHLWLTGSPDTVVEKIRALNGMVGGFGTLLWLMYDYGEQDEAWRKSMSQLADLNGA